MAQVKAANDAAQDNVDDLAEQMKILRSDIAAISKTLGDLGVNTKDAALRTARQKAADLRETSEEQLHYAQLRAEEMGQQAVDAVRKQPATAVGLAVGVGFLLGFISGRK